MIRWISSLAPTSTPWVGSARTQHLRPSTSCRASTTFCALPPDIAPMDCFSLGVFTASRLIMSLATVRLPAAVDPGRTCDSSGRCPAEMLNEMGWNENMPCGLAVGRQQRDARAAAPARGDRGAIASPSSRMRRRWPGPCRRWWRRSRRHRSRRGRTGRRSRQAGPTRPPRGTCPAAPGPPARVAGGPSGTARSPRSSLRMPPTISSAISPDGQLLDRVRADGVAVAHDGDLVGDPEELVEPVRDVDDRDPGVGEPADDAEQHLDLGVGQDRRGLVQDQYLGVARQRLRDRHLLLSAIDSDPRARGRVACRAGRAAQQFDHLRVLRRPVDPDPLRRFPAGEDVLRHGQFGEQLRFLVDGGDAESHRLDGSRWTTPGRPRSRSRPCRRTRPPRDLDEVDLPAPFSPTAWTGRP